MAVPRGIGVVDTMIGFPADDFKMYDFIREQLRDGSKTFEFPVEYMFKAVPKELYGAGDPIALTLREMDKHGVEMGMIGVGGEVSATALKDHPGIEGALVIQWTIDPKGTVIKASVDASRSAINETSVAACVIDIIKKIKFSEHPQGKETNTFYPFDFHPHTFKQ